MARDRVACALFAAAVAAMTGAATALSIDEFSTSRPTVAVAPLAARSGVPGSLLRADILGGERDTWMSNHTGITTLSARASIAANPVLAHTDQTPWSTLHFQWDGADGDARHLDRGGLGSVDLTDAGTSDAFQIRLALAQPAMLSLRVHSDGGRSSFVSIDLDSLAGSDAQTVIIPFAAFAGDALFDDIGAIEMALYSPTGEFDYKIDYLRTGLRPIPLPPALLLLGSGLACCTLWRSRRTRDTRS